MKLPSFRRLFSNDFEGQYKDLLDKLSGTINTGIETLYEALNNKITFSDNIACTIGEFTVTVDSTGKPVGGSSFRLNNTLKVEGLFVISATDNTSGAYPPGAVFVSFTQSGQSVIINNIRGLTAGSSYTLKVIALN